MALEDFLFKFFINPIYTGEGYNIYNTAVYAAGLLLALFGINWWLKRERISVDKEFFWAVFPYILLGGLVRALADYMAAIGLPKHWLFITPGIYFLIFGVFLFTFIVSGWTSDRTKSTKELGWSYALLTMSLVVCCALWRGFDLIAFTCILAMVGGLSLVLWKALDLLKIRTPENMAVCAGQMLDASASAIAVSFLGYFEQHVVSGAIMGLGSPFLFVPVKMAVVLAALYVIDREAKDERWNWLLKIVVLTLGLATGTRDATRVFLRA